jgi:hypothetical protein
LALDGFLAAVAGLPIGGAAPAERDVVVRQMPDGEPFLNQGMNDRLVHEGPRGVFQARQRQIHRGLGASGANPKGRVQAQGLSACQLSSV